MTTLTHTTPAILIDNSIKEMLLKLGNLAEGITDDISDMGLSSEFDVLLPFAGYYAMSIDGKASGAFLSIDSWEFHVSNGLPMHVSFISISVSKDGQTSESYTHKEYSFDGSTLTIPKAALSIVLKKNYTAGILKTFAGSINRETVTGESCFNPVEINTFYGSYKPGPAVDPVLDISGRGLLFDFGSGLLPVNYYLYNPLMFVVLFWDKSPLADGLVCTLMLGTAGRQGLACSISGSELSGMMVLTIPDASGNK